MNSKYERALSIYQNGIKRVKETPVPVSQKFLPGSLVYIKKEMPPHMSHFEGDAPAFVEYTHAHAYGGDDINNYSLIVKSKNGDWRSIAWYQEDQLVEVVDEKEIKKLQEEFRQSKYFT